MRITQLNNFASKKAKLNSFKKITTASVRYKEIRLKMSVEQSRNGSKGNDYISFYE